MLIRLVRTRLGRTVDMNGTTTSGETKDPGNPVSPKATAAGAGSALATLIWVLLGILDVLPSDTDPAVVATATGATSTVLAFFFGYFFNDPTRNVTK
jgi:hypothetical protein